MLPNEHIKLEFFKIIHMVISNIKIFKIYGRTLISFTYTLWFVLFILATKAIMDFFQRLNKY